MNSLKVRITEEEKLALKHQAERNGRSMSAEVRQLIISTIREERSAGRVSETKTQCVNVTK